LITRRKFAIAVSAIALALSLPSSAQQQNKIWRVGFLAPRHVDFVDSDYYYGPFRQGMRELGYVEGKNLVIEWRSAEGKFERLPGLATELVNLKVDVIVTSGSPAISAAQKATTIIPIVMGSTGDPVGSGFVRSLARPAANITGLSGMAGDLSVKQLEMLLSMVPKLSRVAVLVNSSNTSNIKNLESVQAAGQKRGVKILRADARTPQEIDNAFSWIRQQNAGALIVFLDPFFQQQKSQIAELTVKHRLPSIATYPEYAEVAA
jgi:putative ABC transport system substrate-binding protein